MQRRKLTAQISPPSSTASLGGDSEKSPLFSRRSFGVTNRVWTILCLLLAVIILSHHIFSSSQDEHRYLYSNADLKAKNYFNASEAEPNPFPFCPPYGPGDELGSKYGALALAQSKMHLGSGARVQRVINRALAGQPITISILGGSVSACHGAGDDPLSPSCYPSRFFRWWNSVFPHPATELTNGAMRRTNSAYFGYCSMHHVPDVTDLVIVELDTDDIPDRDMLENFENLIRSLLIRPDQPAVVILGHFSPQVHQTYGFNGPDHLHNVVAQFYDVPHISVKSLLFTDYMQDPSSVSKYYVDPVLATPRGHELIADVLISYFQGQVCSAWAVASGSSYESISYRGSSSGDTKGIFGGAGARPGVPEPGRKQPGPKDKDKDVDVDEERVRPPTPPSYSTPLNVPPGRINTRPNSDRPFQEIEPYCVSANDLVNPLPPSLFYGSGWLAYHPAPGSNSLQVRSHYWYSTLPMSRVRIPILVGGGDIGVYYIQEPISDIGEGSAVECWVDDNYAGARVIENAADVGEPTAALKIIDHYVSRGNHYVECELLGEEGISVPSFKIMGIFAT